MDCVDNQCYVGDGVLFDTMYPEKIHIGKSVHVTSGCRILTHYLSTDGGSRWNSGDVYIGDYAFIGMGTLICKDVRIGSHSIVGAGSVVTKNIPDWEIWGAHYIKKKNPVGLGNRFFKRRIKG